MGEKEQEKIFISITIENEEACEKCDEGEGQIQITFAFESDKGHERESIPETRDG